MFHLLFPCLQRTLEGALHQRAAVVELGWRITECRPGSHGELDEGVAEAGSFVFGRSIAVLEMEPFTWQDAAPLVEHFGGRITQSLYDCRHRVLDELAPGHLLLDVGHVQIGVKEHDGVADRVDDVCE
jgi:hypothetical protein